MERILEYIAKDNCTVEKLLKSKGYSSRICNLLKKELGLVCVNDKPVFVTAKVKSGVCHSRCRVRRVWRRCRDALR